MLNTKKTQLITIIESCTDTKPNYRRMVKNIDLNHDGNKINRSNTVKYFGLHFATNGKFTRHIDATVKKTNISISKFNSVCRLRAVNGPVKSLMYKTLIRPIISYASLRITGLA